MMGHQLVTVIAKILPHPFECVYLACSSKMSSRWSFRIPENMVLNGVLQIRENTKRWIDHTSSTKIDAR